MASTDIGQLRREAADNLLRACAGIEAGTDVLFVNERGHGVDGDVVRLLEDRAREIGARVSSIWPARAHSPEEIPEAVKEAIDAAPCTIFNHQMGTMLRLWPFKGKGVRVLNYATSWAVFDSEYTRIPYALWKAVMEQLVPQLMRARTWRIQCPHGTDIAGEFPARTPGSDPGGFTLRPFPMDIHPPLMAPEMSGTLALRWLVTSAAHDLGTEGMSFARPVMAEVVGGRIKAFKGDAVDCQSADTFLRRIGQQYGKDPFLVNSWHAGINPQTRVAVGPGESLEQWMQLAHSSPRVLHLHVVGSSVPGEVSAVIVDPTVTLDDRVVWNAGNLCLLEDAPYQSIATRWSQARAFDKHVDIGL